MPLRLDTQFRPLHPAHRWVNGEPPPSEALRGKPILLHFWAMSCASCHEQLARLVEWEERFGDRVHIISVHTPLAVSDMNEERVVGAIMGHGLRHPVAIDGEDGALADAYDLRMLPSYFVFDQEGRLRHFHAGLKATESVERALTRLLERERREERREEDEERPSTGHDHGAPPHA